MVHMYLTSLFQLIMSRRQYEVHQLCKKMQQIVVLYRQHNITTTCFGGTKRAPKMPSAPRAASFPPPETCACYFIHIGK